MSIQDIFYLFGIVYMVMGIILMIIIGVVLIVIKNKIAAMHRMVEEKIDQINRITENPTDAAINLGSKVAGMAVKKIKDSMKK
jgi:hypothetical protein